MQPLTPTPDPTQPPTFLFTFERHRDLTPLWRHLFLLLCHSYKDLPGHSSNEIQNVI